MRTKNGENHREYGNSARAHESSPHQIRSSSGWFSIHLVDFRFMKGEAAGFLYTQKKQYRLPTLFRFDVHDCTRLFRRSVRTKSRTDQVAEPSSDRPMRFTNRRSSRPPSTIHILSNDCDREGHTRREKVLSLRF